jgi:hypothetical protein
MRNSAESKRFNRTIIEPYLIVWFAPITQFPDLKNNRQDTRFRTIYIISDISYYLLYRIN